MLPFSQFRQDVGISLVRRGFSPISRQIVLNQNLVREGKQYE